MTFLKNIKRNILSVALASGVLLGAQAQENYLHNDQYSVFLNNNSYDGDFSGLEEVVTQQTDSSFSLNLPLLSEEEKNLDVPVFMRVNGNEIYSGSLQDLEIIDNNNISSVVLNLPYETLDDGINNFEIQANVLGEEIVFDLDIYRVSENKVLLDNLDSRENYLRSDLENVLEDNYDLSDEAVLSFSNNIPYLVEEKNFEMNSQDYNLLLGQEISVDDYNLLNDIQNLENPLPLLESDLEENDLGTINLSLPNEPEVTQNLEPEVTQNLEPEVLESEFIANKSLVNLNLGYSPSFSFLGKTGDNFTGLEQLLNFYADLESSDNYNLQNYVLGYDVLLNGAYQSGNLKNNSGDVISEHTGIKFDGSVILNLGYSFEDFDLFSRLGVDYFWTQGVSIDSTLGDSQKELLSQSGIDYEGFVGSQIESLNLVLGLCLEGQRGYLNGNISFPLSVFEGQENLGRQVLEGDLEYEGSFSRTDFNLNAGYFITTNLSIDNNFQIRNIRFDSNDDAYNSSKLSINNDLMLNYKHNLGSRLFLGINGGIASTFETIEGNLDGNVLSSYQINPKVELSIGVRRNN